MLKASVRRVGIRTGDISTFEVGHTRTAKKPV